MSKIVTSVCFLLFYFFFPVMVRRSSRLQAGKYYAVSNGQNSTPVASISYYETPVRSPRRARVRSPRRKSPSPSSAQGQPPTRVQHNNQPFLKDSLLSPPPPPPPAFLYLVSGPFVDLSHSQQPSDDQRVGDKEAASF
ncbi:unnamed protein product [Tetraodon nigroviridis]|uniref:Chromosome undetermined SCAF1899, whole genome shotgun sequence n=1 Tax=Tetraodon nigroviridis TaxID=99883 RepID=Q4TIP9_TETNG|nr:unnamed protein product [Tetraodon nigroviridis]